MTDSTATQPTDLLLHERDARGMHRLTLNSPASFNTLSEAMLTALQKALDVIAQDEQARVVVLAAAGKAFCAGHNLKEMRAQPELAYYQKLFAQCSRMMLAIQKLPVPVIARVQGLATAAGCQLVAQCDLAVSADSATFGVNGIDVGLFCATPSVPLVRNMQAKQAMEMLLAGGWSTGCVQLPSWMCRWMSWCRPSWPNRARRCGWARPCFTSSAKWALKRRISWRAKPWPATWCMTWRKKAFRLSSRKGHLHGGREKLAHCRPSGLA
jgi:hypothetical protein